MCYDIFLISFTQHNYFEIHACCHGSVVHAEYLIGYNTVGLSIYLLMGI